jgi:hypothetical protein
MFLQRSLSKVSSRLLSQRTLQGHTQRKRLRRLLIEQLEDRKLLTAPHPLSLGALNGTNGFRLDGIDQNDRSGLSVSSAGDVNGDGFDDLIVGASRADPSGVSNAGESYVVFGKSGGFASSIVLSSLNGSDGFRLDGIDPGDYSGFSVSSAGDVNGDGFDDLIIGAQNADPGGNNNAGESYVLFGKSAGFASAISLSGLNGTSGFRIDGIDAYDVSGFSVSSAGDVNGDGFDDLVIGARYADPGGNSGAGESYVLFGKSTGFASAISLSSLNGSNGFRIDGINVGDFSGFSVSSAGDVNGDGFDDLVIGARYADPGGNNSAGQSYVLFGNSTGFSSVIPLNSLNGSNGFRLDGIDANDFSGFSVSSAGDINGDGFDEMIVGAFGADPDGSSYAGESYVLFGKSTGFASAISLSSLNGSNGFRLDGIDAYDASGFSVSSAGDVNGDGFDDLVIGAAQASPGGNSSAGESYVLFGKSTGFASAISLGSLNGTNGFRIEGINSGDISGSSVSNAGDVNGDGFDDLIIGARYANPGGNRFFGGESYVIFGGNFTGGSETQVGGNGSDTFTANQGSAAIDILIGGQGIDTLISDGGDDVLIGGQASDILAIPDVDFSGTRRILGGSGNDTLRLDGSGLTLDLTTINDNRIADIEQINLTGSGDNRLVLNAREVLNLSSHSNTLIVRRNAGDSVDIGPGWTRLPDELLGILTFQVFKQGAATVKIQSVPASVVGSFVNHVGFSGAGTTIDSGKQLAKQSATPTLLTYDNLINTSQGLNGLVFDIDGLRGAVTASDFSFQVSPTGAFDALANPVESWASAPAPASVTVTPGSPARVSIIWPNNAIANRWLRVTVKANFNTGLAAPEVFYAGHLLGETTGASGSVFTVSFSDITPIRDQVGSTYSASSTVDIDKSGTVAFADISAMRPNVGAQLTLITIPGSGGGGGQATMTSGQGGGDDGKNGSTSVPSGLEKETVRPGKVNSSLQEKISQSQPPTAWPWREAVRPKARTVLSQPANTLARDQLFEELGSWSGFDSPLDLRSWWRRS